MVRKSAEGEPGVPIEGYLDLLVVILEADPGPRRVNPPAADPVALEPGPVLSAGLESELPELLGHIGGGHLEAAARRVPPHHRIVGDDSDALRHVGRSDRGRRIAERRGRLGRESSEGKGRDRHGERGSNSQNRWHAGNPGVLSGIYRW